MIMIKYYLMFVCMFGVVIIVIVGFGGCVIYKDEFVLINLCFDQFDVKVQGVVQSVEFVNQFVQQVN